MSCRQASVFISVYVVKPRRSTSDRRRHNHHHCHRVRRHARGGNDRKAELLQYCQQLRATARRAPETPSNPPANQIVPSNRSPSIGRSPACWGDWKRVLIPGCILRSAGKFRRRREKHMTANTMNDSIGNTIHAIAKSLRVEKRQGFVKKLLSALRVHK